MRYIWNTSHVAVIYSIYCTVSVILVRYIKNITHVVVRSSIYCTVSCYIGEIHIEYYTSSCDILYVLYSELLYW